MDDAGAVGGQSARAAAPNTDLPEASRTATVQRDSQESARHAAAETLNQTASTKSRRYFCFSSSASFLYASAGGMLMITGSYALIVS